jgi:hypothetical protein
MAILPGLMFSNERSVSDFAYVRFYMNVATVVHLSQKIELGANHDKLPFFVTKIQVWGEKTIKWISGQFKPFRKGYVIDVSESIGISETGSYYNI